MWAYLHYLAVIEGGGEILPQYLPTRAPTVANRCVGITKVSIAIQHSEALNRNGTGIA